MIVEGDMVYIIFAVDGPIVAPACDCCESSVIIQDNFLVVTPAIDGYIAGLACLVEEPPSGS